MNQVKSTRKKPTPLVPRSLALLRQDGWTAEKAEHWQSLERGTGQVCQCCHREIKRVVSGPPGVRKDLFGVVDIMAIKEGQQHLWVQVLSLDTWSSHFTKARATDALYLWLATYGRFQFHCWRRLGTAKRWRCLVRELKLVEPGLVRIVETDQAPTSGWTIDL